MGRRAKQSRINDIVAVIKESGGQVRAADIARELGLSRSSVTRLLPAVDEQSDVLLTEERGFLGIFKRR